MKRLLLVLLLVTAGLVVPARAEAAALRFVDIPGAGVTLKANVATPAGSGLHPAVVMPSSWGLNDIEYVAQAQALAARGYVVVSYTPRGWWLSGGEIDTAGPRDLADLSAVIDWVLANTPADPGRIGAAGVSYGAGISLLGAGADPRIRAVGVLSGWTDLTSSLYGDDTRHRQAADLLGIAASTLGRPGTDLSTKLADFAANRNVDEVQAWADERSAATHLAAINANHPAVLIANAWGDSFFPPGQLTSFFGGLTGPKRLELRPGDHAIAELTGLLGLPNAVWTSLYRWFDQYLAGVGTGIDDEPPVQLVPWNAPAEQYASWPSFSARELHLGRAGLLGSPSAEAWTKSLPTDKDTIAGGGVVLLTNGAAAFTGQRPKIWLPAVDRTRAGVWAAARPATVQRLRGSPRLHLALRNTPPTGTIVAYLYDLDALGTATLITHAPASWLGTTPGDRTLDVDLWPTAYDVPAGHSLTLVVDTTDPLYYDENAPGRTITVATGSRLDVPIR
ncbi:CocE/NonD family hydrolase [Actinoplanes sp. RD1]|uniref:CocE/NonD family hydrolase n=1 Tax=Actinoplanes sp. RD1 TaxID=3064538 RepID=UPI002741775D|nr:CocE/NonD family hydrolase [Actinoplanes sp. RD1]